MTKAKTKSKKVSEEKVQPAAEVKTTVRTVRSFQIPKDLVLGALTVELVGTFVLSTVILQNSNSALIAGIALAFLVAALTRLSGAHFNPATTIALFLAKKVSAVRAAGYVIAQVLGGMLALVVVTQFVSAAPADATMQTAAAKVFTVTINSVDTWRPLLAELLGGLVFGLAIAGTVFGRKESGEKGFVQGAAYLIALILAGLGSVAILNPAVAIALSAFKTETGAAFNWWALVAYTLGPVVGVTAGVWLYKLLRWDIEGGSIHND